MCGENCKGVKKHKSSEDVGLWRTKSMKKSELVSVMLQADSETIRHGDMRSQWADEVHEDDRESPCIGGKPGPVDMPTGLELPR